ncbi:hypothetical protein D3C76_982830 [compost metagenome]
MQRQAGGQVSDAVALEPRAAEFPMAEQGGGGPGADQFGQAVRAGKAGVGVDLHPAIVLHQVHAAGLAEAEVADQRRQLAHVQAQPGDAEQPAVALDALVDEQRQLAGTAVGVDVEDARLAALDEAEVPGVLWVVVAERALAALVGVVGARRAVDDQRREGPLRGAQAAQIADEIVLSRGIGAGGEPVLHQAVVGDAGDRRDRAGQLAFEVVADGFDARRQRLFEQVAFAQAVDQQGVQAEHDEQAEQQRAAHAEDQLGLNTAMPRAHVGMSS